MSAVEQRFGPYGGRYVPETLIAALDELTAAWEEARDDPDFNANARYSDPNKGAPAKGGAAARKGARLNRPPADFPGPRAWVR